MIFRDRIHAGQELASELYHRGFGQEQVILALPRGGVPVAFEVARKLSAPMDIFVVRKLGVPGHEEYAMGAIGPGPTVIVNQAVIQSLGISEEEVLRVINHEEAEMQRRIEKYRAGRGPLNIEAKQVILIDDGLATGATMRVACQSIRQFGIQSLRVAVPVAAENSCREIATIADEVICLANPEPFYGVGQWYRDFSQVTDDEVIALMEECRRTGSLYQVS